MDVIRCDEPSYLIWKWHPHGSQQGENNRENAIRWGSSLRVKDGEIAVFIYNQENGTMQDFIEGPYDQILETENLPVLASIVGLAYKGETPFQAEVYFINLARVIQIPFAVPFFDLYDPRFLDFGVPTAVRGKITFNIADYIEFIKLHRLSNFDLNAFRTQIRDAVARFVKSIVANAPAEKNIPVVQIEREIPKINELVEASIRDRFEKDFGVNITAVDINSIEVDKTSEGFVQLKKVTQDVTTAIVQAQTEVNIKNLQDIQRINAENMEETMKIQREEAQYAQRKQTQGANFAAYQFEQQAAVGIAGANALGQMGVNGATEMSGGGGMNPASMMTGMAMGGVIGQNMAGMMNNMMGGVQRANLGTTSPPVIVTAYHVAVNGQATGPFDIATLTQMATSGTLTKSSLVWKQGMAGWVAAETVQELQTIFGGTVPPIPPVPPTL
ncbi:SPFH domain-containing protein [Neobacillus sp. WH10]|uniref:SPFH domain-containing protein n=1 Tax=Neobacillus sp. WH10 TaxID=3047873 RepID=UPI0024C12376|nr:SPFH domain-containing protein [Neobacillus sp. WH10]WHY78133.1 SPFH domain-containing protein [Neobacillus sp. WH10]